MKPEFSIFVSFAAMALATATPAFAQAAAPVPAASATPTEAALPDPAAVKARAKQVQEWKRTYGEGPYPDETAAFVDARPAALQPYYRTLFTGGERNAVLNMSRLGLAAMELGLWTDAERAFDGALLRIEAVYSSKNPQAEAARSIWHKESNKDWKGEPYERAMAYYYRGLLYLRSGDHYNARASFKSAEYQDTVSEVEEFKSDFALMNYLTGWASQCAGESGESDFAAASATTAGLVAPNRADNVLLIAELGHGPVKARDGTQKEKLVFRPAEGFPETGAAFKLTASGGKAKPKTWDVPATPASSVLFQATTRGGRAMDGILNGKANWKSTTDAIGSTSMNVGLAMMSQSSGYGNTAGAGAAIAVAGLMFSAFSSAMKTDADIRQWDSLPDGVVIGTASAPGDFDAAVNFMGSQGDVAVSGAPIMKAKGGKCALVWARSRSSLLDPETPGDDAKVRAAVSRKKDVVAKDRAFRAALTDTYRS